MNKTAIITGITGQDGAYLSQLLLQKNYHVIGLVRPDMEENFFGLKYLNLFDRIILKKCDLLDLHAIKAIIKEFAPDEIYNLAAQSSVGFSFEQPLDTIRFNVISVVNLMEAIKNLNHKIRFYQASSSEMYGNINTLPVREHSEIHPTSPYGISKASGHWTAVNYRESYGLFICCGILFNHESFLRTPNFFVKKVIQHCLEIKAGLRNELRVGDIHLRRDFGYAPDYVKAMWLMLQQEVPKDYIICSGTSISLQEIVLYVFDKLGIEKSKLNIDPSLIRPIDIRDIYGTNERAKSELGWEYNRSFFEVLDILIEEEERNRNHK